jgi:phage terminase large subunit
LILRKIRARCRESVVKVMRTLLDEQGVKYEENKSDLTMKFDGNELLFDGLDNSEKIKSIKGITSIWAEELTAYSERDFIDVDMILREPGPGYHQIMGTFNPDEAEAPWIKRRFFDNIDPEAFIHLSTVEDNPIAEIRERYRAVLDALKQKDESLYKIYRLGLWAAVRGLIFPAWDVVPLPRDIQFDNIFYGGDFGYTVDPAALVRIYRKANEYWLQEIIYETGLTNQQLARESKSRGVTDDADTFWDEAEPKSIQELRDAGLNAMPAPKGRDSRRAGIDFLLDCKIHVIEGSENIIEERRTYKWKEDKDGKPTNEPVDYNNHAMDAIRYGIYTEAKRGGANWGIKWI